MKPKPPSPFTWAVHVWSVQDGEKRPMTYWFPTKEERAAALAVSRFNLREPVADFQEPNLEALVEMPPLPEGAAPVRRGPKKSKRRR